jgi:hypothetical protein
MSADYALRTIGGLSYGEALWRHFRNGLAHSFAVSHGGFEGNPDGPYFVGRDVAGRDSLKINPTLLYDDYVVGFERYLAELRQSGQAKPLLQDSHVVFQQVFIEGN